MPGSRETGKMAEDAAAQYLARRGFDVLHRNWRHGRYELDIVAAKGVTLHIVEVKCRNARGLTTPEEAASPAKFRALTKAAEAYIEDFGIELEVQFDLIAVDLCDRQMDIRYIPDAFVPKW